MNNYDDIMTLIGQQSEMALAAFERAELAFERAELHKRRAKHWRRWALNFALLAAVEFVIILAVVVRR